MSRDYFINGPTLVSVNGNSGTAISSLTQLGLSDAPIRVRVTSYHRDMVVDAWGAGTPETQYMLGEAFIPMSLIHVDRTVLSICQAESQAGASADGTVPGAGARMGNGLPRFGVAQAGVANHFIGLNLTSPIGNIPWRFYYAYLAGNPIEFPLGTEKSIIQLNWRAVLYSQDPWQNGLGSAGQILFDHTLDS